MDLFIVVISSDEDDLFLPSSQATPPPDSQIPSSETDFLEILSSDEDLPRSSSQPVQRRATAAGQTRFTLSSLSNSDYIELSDESGDDCVTNIVTKAKEKWKKTKSRPVLHLFVI